MSLPPWERLAAAYAYPKDAPLDVAEEPRDDPEYRLSRLSFRSEDRHRFAGLLLRPRTEGALPCVLLLHALSSDKETMIRSFGRALAPHGIASLALDAHLHGERKSRSARPLSPLDYLDLARESVIEYRQALDHLNSRPDIDPHGIGLLGYSLGAMMGAILAGVDVRVKASVLMVGGDMVRANLPLVPGFLRERLERVSPANFVSHISPRPVFFINGKGDDTVPRSAAELLHEAAQQPKQILWSDAGHILPPEIASLGVDWLVEHLAPGGR